MIINIYKNGTLINKLAEKIPPMVGDKLNHCCKEMRVVSVRYDVRPIQVEVIEKEEAK